MSDGPHWEIRVDPDAAVLRATLSGDFDLPLWMRVLEAVPDTPGFRPGMSSVFDCRGARFQLSAADAQRIAAYVATRTDKRGSDFRSAFVVDRDVDYGVSRMIQMMLDGLPFQTRVFRSLDEAVTWVLE